MFIFDTRLRNLLDLEPQTTILVGGSAICSLDPPKLTNRFRAVKKKKQKGEYTQWLCWDCTAGFGWLVTRLVCILPHFFFFCFNVTLQVQTLLFVMRAMCWRMKPQPCPKPWMPLRPGEEWYWLELRFRTTWLSVSDCFVILFNLWSKYVALRTTEMLNVYFFLSAPTDRKSLIIKWSVVNLQPQL